MKQVMTMKREYARPEMRVVELRHKCCILAGSGSEPAGAQKQDYESEEWY
jgi:hypothetical protein